MSEEILRVLKNVYLEPTRGHDPDGDYWPCPRQGGGENLLADFLVASVFQVASSNTRPSDWRAVAMVLDLLAEELRRVADGFALHVEMTPRQ